MQGESNLPRLWPRPKPGTHLPPWKNCIHCEGNHPTFSAICPQMKYQKEVNTILAYNNISIYEACTQAENNAAHNPTTNTTNISRGLQCAPQQEYPPLPECAMESEYKLRVIGGVSNPNIQKDNRWNTGSLKTYAISSSTTRSRSPKGKQLLTQPRNV